MSTTYFLLKIKNYTKKKNEGVVKLVSILLILLITPRGRSFKPCMRYWRMSWRAKKFIIYRSQVLVAVCRRIWGWIRRLLFDRAQTSSSLAFTAFKSHRGNNNTTELTVLFLRKNRKKITWKKKKKQTNIFIRIYSAWCVHK